MASIDTTITQTEQTIALYRPLIDAYRAELALLTRSQLARRCAEVFPRFPSLRGMTRDKQCAALLKKMKDGMGYEGLIAQRNRLCEERDANMEKSA